MKRLSLLIFALILVAGVLPALAQQDNPDLISLNDATPAIDVVITLPPDTTGTISLDFAQAGVRLLDATGTVVFTAADPRLHALELNIAPNTGSHTLTVERLSGAAEAYVRVTSLPEMTVNSTVQLVESNTLTLNQEAQFELNANTPGGTVTVSIPTETTGVVTAIFPGASATSQLIDSQGLVLAESTGGHVDGLTYVVDSGDYQFTLLGSGLSDTVVAGVRVVSSTESGFTVLQVPATVEPITGSANRCAAIVTASSASLRSGPGTGYSILGYGYRGETFEAGGQNPQNNWLLVSTDTGSAWLAMSAVQVQGTCNALTVFDIPLVDAAAAPLVITSPGSNNGYHDDDDEGEHEEFEHEEGEGEHDD